MTRGDFAAAVLNALGFSPRPEAIRGLEAWMQAEGTSASNNPLATTQGWSGASNFNSVGVKNYASEDDGVAATVRTLTNGLYHPILEALASGTAMDLANAVAGSPWGTGSGVIRVLGGKVAGDASIGAGGSGKSGGANSSAPAMTGPGGVRELFAAFVGRDPTADELSRYGGQTTDSAQKAIQSTPESEAFATSELGMNLLTFMKEGAA